MPPPIYTGTVNNTPGQSHTAGYGVDYLGRPRQLFIGASEFRPTGATAANANLTKLAAGTYAQVLAASQTTTLIADLGQPLSNVLLPPLPPQGGGPAIYTQATYNNTGISAGVGFVSVVPIFKIIGAALTSGSVGLTSTAWPATLTAANPTVVNLLATTALATAVNANIYSPVVPVTTTTPVSTSLSQVLAEINFTTPAGSTVNFYGVLLNILVNG